MSDQLEFVSLGDVDSIADKSCKGFKVGALEILLARAGGAFYAVEDRCSHAESTLSEGRLKGFIIYCPLHGAGFDIRSGDFSGPPACEGIDTFPVRVKDGKVEVGIPKARNVDRPTPVAPGAPPRPFGI